MNGAAGKGCNAQLSFSKSKVRTLRVSGKQLLFDKKAWAKVNDHHDKRVPGFVITQEPKHGSISGQELKSGRVKVEN
ncbi:MAG: hypothetical protein KTR32_32450 [Granulosicoccus sp.]|nr:hypothetical protein [Granulosicoccus sp.]